MKSTNVTVRWPMGLNLHPAARLAQIARAFRSHIQLTLGGRVADASNVLSIVVLCAAMNAVVEIQASGADEHEALRAVEAFFDTSPAKNFRLGRSAQGVKDLLS